MIWQALGIGICSTVLCLILRQNGRKEYAMLVGVIASIGMLVLCAGEIAGIIESAKHLAVSSGLSYDFFEPAIKITGVAYLAQMGAELCRDAGEGAVAAKIEIAGKVLIAAMALPIMKSLFEIISTIVV